MNDNHLNLLSIDLYGRVERNTILDAILSNCDYLTKERKSDFQMSYFHRRYHVEMSIHSTDSDELGNAISVDIRRLSTSTLER